jgi:hypothetical protein
MLLTSKDVSVFFNLQRSLLFFVNQRLQVIPDGPANPDGFSSVPPETRLKVRNALLQHMDLIQSFVGWVNFLHDKSQTPYMRLSDIDAHFGVSESSGAAKLVAIRKMLKIHQLDPNWTLPSRLADNPMVWMIQYNGFLMDVRHAPREVQEIAFNKGLIPYIPADRPQGG